MGCAQSNDEQSNTPMLLLEFTHLNTNEKEYCSNLTKNFKCEKKISFSLSDKNDRFRITIIIKKKPHVIEDTFDGSEAKMNESLQKIYSLLK